MSKLPHSSNTSPLPKGKEKKPKRLTQLPANFTEFSPDIRLLLKKALGELPQADEIKKTIDELEIEVIKYSMINNYYAIPPAKGLKRQVGRMKNAVSKLRTELGETSAFVYSYLAYAGTKLCLCSSDLKDDLKLWEQCLDKLLSEDKFPGPRKQSWDDVVFAIAGVLHRHNIKVIQEGGVLTNVLTIIFDALQDISVPYGYNKDDLPQKPIQPVIDQCWPAIETEIIEQYFPEDPNELYFS